MRMTETKQRSVTLRQAVRGAWHPVLIAMVVLAACGGGDGITSSTSVASIRFVVLPGNVAVNQSFTVQVELVGSGGTRITTATNRVTLTASGSTLSGTTAVDAVDGLALFSGLSLTTPGTTVTLTAEAAGRTVTSAVFAAQDPCTPITLSIPSTVTGAVQANSCLSSGARAVIYRFAAPPTGAAAFSVTADFAARFDVATEPPGNNVGLAIPAGQAVLAEWLLPAGNFLFRVGAQSGGGNFTVTSSNPAGNSGCIVRLLVVGGTFAQSLGANDCPYGDVPNWFEDVFAILSNQPCTITMRSSQVDAFLEIRDLNENVHFSNDDFEFPVTTDAQVQMPQCSLNGSAAVIGAGSLDPGEVGAYTLTVTLTGAEPAQDIVLDAPTVMSSLKPVRVASPRPRPQKR